MHEACEIVAYVCSERAVVGAWESRGVVRQVATLSGPTYATVRTAAVTWGWRLGNEDAHALAEARRIAEETGSPLRVVDLGRCNPLTRALRLHLLGDPALPAVIMKGSCRWDRLALDRGSGRSLEAAP